jgi:hypothetical protein
VRRSFFGVVLAALVLVPAGAAQGQASNARYELAGGCHDLRSQSLGRTVATGAGPFRMQATALGRYLLYGKAQDFLAADGSGGVEQAAAASPDADWRVDDAGGGAFRLFLPSRERVLAATADGGLELADAGAAGDRALFTFPTASGCPAYPEVEINAEGRPFTNPTSYGETRGLVDSHMHLMAFEFLGGEAHCGRPWHAYGAPYALSDCVDHTASGGCGAVLENALYGNPARCHDPVGWPTFNDWPAPTSLTHEQSYYRWLERAWKGGLRVYVNLFVENGVLCELYPIKRNSCDEMTSVRLQNQRIRELEDYIDAQAGGPGKGFFRIVTTPYEARRVVNQGKLAVVLGIEISRLFGCRVRNDVPQCDKAQIDRQLDEVYGFGVRQMELINKFDNALGGVAGDAATFGVAVNQANLYETGKYWQFQHCDGDGHDHDRSQTAGHESIEQLGLQALVGVGTLPVYPPPPHCNIRGLSDLGEHLTRRMIDKRMIVDPDHLSVLAREQLLAIVEAERYSGVVSSHSWSTPDAYRRIYKSGGFVAPYAGNTTSFAEEWKAMRAIHNPRYPFGIGYGADMNGFGNQGRARPGNEANPVVYPFRSFDGGVSLDKQRSGSRVFDINTDGVAHYGLYPDWVEDLRKIAGQAIVDDLARGSEAYLQMWERADGIRPKTCVPARRRVTRRGLNDIRMGLGPEALLRSAGQPLSRPRRAYRYCVRGKRNRRTRAAAVFSARGKVVLVGTNAFHPRPRVRRIGRGAPVRRLRARGVRRIGKGLWVSKAARGRAGRRRARLVYGVRRGRVRFVAVAARGVAVKRKRLRAHLRLAGLR